jgi:RHS repeat-associated protein
VETALKLEALEVSDGMSLFSKQCHRTEYTYDGNNRKITETRKSVAGTSAADRVTHFTYDAADRLIKEEIYSTGSGPNRVVEYSYNNLDRLTGKVVKTSTTFLSPSGFSVKSLWNRALNGVKGKGFTDVIEETSSYTYASQLDAVNLTAANNDVANLTFTNETSPPFLGSTFAMTAAVTGNPLGLLEGTYTINRGTSGGITSIVNPSSATILTNTFDDAGRLLTAGSGTFTSTLTYDGMGRKYTVSHSSGPGATYTYDALNRITDVTWTGSVPAVSTLTYNTAGNITGLAREHGTYALTYDDVDQLLTSATSGGSGSFVNYNRTLSYDLVGNRTGDNVNGTGTFLANFLTGNGIASYAADADGFGDLAQETIGSTTKNYAYRSDGLMTGYSSGSNSAAYSYDALGRRVAKSLTNGSGSFIQSFLYLDKENRILAANSGTGTTTVYVDGQGANEHLGEVTGSSVTGYVTDYLGSVLNSDPAGASHQFGLFGEANSTVTLTSSSKPVTYGFAGYSLDAISGNYETHYRMYSPVTGRWSSQDPIGIESGDPDYYRYAFNSPLLLVDPYGTDVMTGPYKISLDLYLKLTELNELFPGKDVVVTGANRYRDKDGNIRSSTTNELIPKSARESKHLSGQAVDFVIPGISNKIAAEASLRVGFSWVDGEYKEGPHVHADMAGKAPERLVCQ